jgi:beta-lactamase class A
VAPASGRLSAPSPRHKEEQARTESGGMAQTRRDMLVSSLLGAGALTLPAVEPALAHSRDRKHHRKLARRIVAEFRGLPGRKGLKIWAPGGDGGRKFEVAIRPRTALFCASAFKAFVLAEYLRQVEAGELTLDEQLDLDESVWSPSSPVFNPPELAGRVTALTALQAMIARSDNTATDMALKRAGADRVREFIAAIGLKNARIPTTTRQFFGYVAGYPQWQTITWDEVVEILENDPYPTNPILNDTITMAVSSHDFVSFYARALQGEFFQHEGTLRTFRSVLALADSIPRAFPLGVNAFLKGGSIDFAGEHALSLAGGMYVPDRWVYFSLIINWTDAQGGTVAEEQGHFAAAVMKIFTWIRDELGNCRF